MQSAWKERIAKKATDSNQQLYQKNYHSGPKDKCSETKKKKRKNGEKHDTKKTYKQKRQQEKLHKQFLGPQASLKVTPCSPASNLTRGEVLNKHK